MMKRWMAMVLCAVLPAGVLPVAAGAADNGLYEAGTLGDQGVPTGTPINTVQLGDSGPTGYSVSYTSGNAFQGKTWYYYDNNYIFPENFHIDTGYRYVTVSRQNEHVLCITIQGDCVGSGSFGLDYNNGGFPFVFNDTTADSGNAEQIGGDTPFAGLTKISDSHPVADNEKVSADVTFAPVPFMYGGTTYYIGPAWLDQHEGNPVRGDSEGFLENEGSIWRFRIGFWTASEGENGLEYTSVSNDLYNTLFGQFSDLTLTMEATADCTTFPALYHDDNQTHIYAAVSSETAGLWVLHVTGKLNGSNISAYGDSECRAMTSEVYAPEHIASLDEVTSYFSNRANTAQNNGVYTFVIPEGTYIGSITTPATEKKATFEIKGAQNDQGKSLVTINGGVAANAFETRLTGLQFKGEGKGISENNDCITGTGAVTFWNCSFKDFNQAMVCTGDCGLRWGGDGCLFEDNNVALLMNSTRDDGGNGEMWNMIFKNNNTALKLEKFAPGMPVYAHHMTNCQFINNGVDVDNSSGRMFFMPKQFFGTQTGDPGAISVATPKFSTAGNVSAFPTAKTTDFNDFDYTQADPVVSNSLTYAIPTGNLTGKTITVIDQSETADKTLATWSFGANEEGGN